MSESLRDRVVGAVDRSLESHWTRERLARLVERVDSYANARTGLGVLGHDPATAARIARSADLTYEDVVTLWRQNVYAERQIEELPRHALRDGYEIDTGGILEAEQLAEWAHQFGLDADVREVVNNARAHGDAYLLLVTDEDLDLTEPLPETGYSLLNVIPLADHECEPREWGGDVTDRDTYDRARLYDVTTVGLGASTHLVVHASRVIHVAGKRLPRHIRAQRAGRNDSVLEASKDQTRRQAVLEQVLEALISRINVSVVKVSHKKTAEGTPGRNATAMARVKLLSRLMSVLNLIVLDVGEDFVQSSIQLSGVADLADRVGQGLAAASRGMPLTLLFGTTPKGFSTDDKAGARNWQLSIDDLRTDELTRLLYRLWYVILGATNGPTAGVRPEKIKVVWPGGDVATEDEPEDTETEPPPGDAPPAPTPPVDGDDTPPVDPPAEPPAEDTPDA